MSASGYNPLMTRETQDTDILQAALIGYRHQIAEIEAKMADIQGKLDGTSATAPTAPKRVLSAAARRRIAAAQKKRWAAVCGAEAAKTKSPSKPVPVKKRRISAAGRKRIIAATKKRWVAFRAKKAAAA
jgi:hypothetical protein